MLMLMCLCVQLQQWASCREVAVGALGHPQTALGMMERQ